MLFACIVIPDGEEIEGAPCDPEITQALDSLTIQDGNMARLECMVVGNPKPRITWFHESTIVKPSPDFLQFYDDDNKCSLIVKEVFPEDTGRYTVVAKNPYGVATCSADMTVEQGECMDPLHEHLLIKVPFGDCILTNNVPTEWDNLVDMIEVSAYGCLMSRFL